MSKIDDYKQAEGPLPQDYRAWEIFGAGFDNVGKDDGPTPQELREPAANEILLRVDALGLCLSDIKIINLGGEHPRLRGRDLSTDPTVLGHECSATVVKVGEQWKEKFHPGERFIIQADIYYKGEGIAFGYQIRGGLAQYCYLDERALDGDEGCYLLPVKRETGYSQAALSEPWACVEMSYALHERMVPLTNPPGKMLIVGEGHPEFAHAVRVKDSLERLPEGNFDDIIIVQPSPETVHALAPRLRKNGVMFLLGKPTSDGDVVLDIGRIHYEGIRYYGGGADLAQVAAAVRRYDLKPGGSALFIGGAGPMGQMHVQRSIEMEWGPKRVIVTGLETSRLRHLESRFGDMAKERGISMITVSREDYPTNEAMDEAVRALGEGGYSDIIVIAPSAAIVTGALPMAASGALINVFAGVNTGQTANVRLADLCRGIKIYGSSGSRISDLRTILQKVEKKTLNTNLSIAAIGGLKAAKEGLKGLRDARFPGKTVIYPQIPDLPLMGIEEIPERLPELKDKLGPGGAWTKEAEQALIEKHL